VFAQRRVGRGDRSVRIDRFVRAIGKRSSGIARRTMTRNSKKLNDYESRQVERIAAWKSEFPNPFGELFRAAAQPLGKAVKYIIPDSVALLAIESTYRAAEVAATANDIKVQAGVKELSALRQRPLELCDKLSRRVGTIAQVIATAEGALTGAGGVWTTLLDVPLLFGVCLRTILKVGHCYGYPLDRPSDKAWVLGAFAVSLSSTRQKRTELMARLREIEDLLLEQTQQQVVVEEAAALITQIELFEDIPVFGAATGALLNLSVAHKTETTARRLFQERWLRDNGKVETIEPAADGNIPATHGWAGALARAGYGIVYNAAFGAALPVALGCALLKPVASPFRGLGRRAKRLVAA
jgi:hypothetical protein